MNQLNDSQREMVTKNHNLIYGYIKRKGIKKDDWYGILAITLCESVLSYDYSKGKLSTYFYRLADNAVSNEIQRRKYKKRSKYDEVSLDSIHDLIPTKEYDIDESQICASNEITTIVVKMVLDGYKQFEIAKELGVSQPYISQLLAKDRKSVV